jgi:amino acid transporter
MKKIVLTYGLISGAIISALMIASLPLENRIGFNRSLFVGYTIMVASFLLVFFGVKTYRDRERGGEITFGRALGVGLLIMLITCVFYVVTWEIVYFNFMPDFMDKYAAHILDEARAAGASAAVLQAKSAELQKMKVLYSGVVMNSLMTFLEPLPVGLVMALVSAAVLRRKKRSPGDGEPAKDWTAQVSQ